MTLLARVLGNAGIPVVQADFSGITYTVRDLATATTVATSSPLTVSQVVYNALQQSDQRWTVDSQYAPGPDRRWGYNFAATLPASLFPTPWNLDTDGLTVIPHRLQATVAFTPVSGQPFSGIWQWAPIPAY